MKIGEAIQRKLNEISFKAHLKKIVIVKGRVSVIYKLYLFVCCRSGFTLRCF